MAIRNSLKIFLLLIFPLSLQAQEPDITGLWKGFMFNDTTQQNLRYEIAISEEKGKLYGYSHQYFIVGDKEYHGVKKLRIKREGDEIITEETDLIVHNYPEPPAKGVHQLNTLTLQIKGSTMILSGGYKTNRTKSFRPLTGYVHVERNYDYKQSALVPHLQELDLAKNLTFLKEEAEFENSFVLKPVTSDEAITVFVSEAKKQQANTQIKSSTAPAVKIPEVAPVKEKETAVAAAEKETKQPAASIKEAPKTTDVVSNKAVATPSPAPVKKPEPIIAKTTQPEVKPVTQQPAAKSKPVTKPAETVVVKTETTPQPAIVKPVVPKTQPIITDPTAATNLANRKVETIKAIYFKSDSLTLTLYDNGEIDGDTVSVIMNGAVIMPKVGLTTNAVKKTIYTNQLAGDSIQLIMYAESLGSLPPNTGLLIVNDGNDRYEIRFSGDMQKSSAIVFRRRK